MFFLYFLAFSASYISIEDIKTMNYVINKKCYSQQNVLYFRFFRTASVCHDETALHTTLSYPNQVQRLAIWIGFQLTGTPRQKLINGISCLNALCCVEVILVYSKQPYLTTAVIYIMARTT